MGFAAVAALLVLLAPVSSAHGTVTFTAPYTGFAVSNSAFVNATGCGHASNPTPLAWNSTSGTFQFAAAASAGLCARGADAYGEAFTSLTSPLFSAPYNGFGSIDLSLSTAFSAKAVLHLGASSNFSYATSEVALSIGVYVYDATHHNDSLVAYTTVSLVDQYFYGASGSFSLTQGWTSSYVVAYGTFTGGHVYQAIVSLSAYAFADTYGGGSSASASIDLGGSNGLVISSITAY